MSGRRFLGYHFGKPFGRFDFLAKYSTYAQISLMVSSGSLLSYDAMFFSVPYFLVKNAFFGDGFFLYLFFHKFLFKVF